MRVATRLSWADTIPDGWKVVPLKHVSKFTTGWTPPTGEVEAYIGDNLWANISDLGPRVLKDTAKRLSDEAVTRHSIALSPAGSLLFSFKLSIGQVSFAGLDMFTNEAIATFRPDDGIDLNFAYYAFPEMIPRNASENIYGAKMLNQQLINSAHLVLPPVREQAAIAAFLDRETGKIDALVAEQRRLIELLKEERQAVISHAVTKGLDPNAKMKPSVVEWLVEVPEDWEVAPLKRFWTVTDCKHVTAEFLDDGFPVASIAEAQSWFVDLRQAKLTSQEYFAALTEGGRKPAAGDLLFTRNATVGAVAQVAEWHPPFAMGQDVCILRRREAAQSPDFMQFVLTSTSVAQQLALAMVGATFKRVNVEDIRSLVVAMPPAGQQTSIAAHLLSKVEALDGLVDAAREAEGLLLERRTALISAAVTGKIDVRQLETHPDGAGLEAAE